MAAEMQHEEMSVKSNPGTVEDLHKRCQMLFPMFFEGAKLMINKGLNSNFQVSHTLTMAGAGSPPEGSGYRFGATYVGSHTMGPGEAYPLLLADVSASGDLNANIVHAFSPKIKSKFIAQIQKSKWQSCQMTTDYFSDFYTASITLGNPDVIHGSGVAVAHYLRKVTKSTSLGTELAYQASPQIPGGHVAVVSVAGRYAPDEDSAFGLTLGNGGQLHATYYTKCSQELEIGTELETNLKMGESSASIGYSVQIPKGDFTLKGSVDSNFVVKSVIEKKLIPLPFTFALCSMINHKKSQYQFGCGLIIG